jgi:hypothetical protein
MADEITELNVMPQGEAKFRGAVRRQNRFVNFLAILGVPGAVGIWLSVADPESVGFWPFWVVLSVLILVQVALYFVSTAYAETVPELHLENCQLHELQESMIEAIATGDEYVGWLEAANRIGSYWSTFQGIMSAIQPNDPAKFVTKFSEACRIAVTPMIDAAGTLFDFDYGEIWSVAVYGLNEVGDLLEPIWWDRPADHPSQGTPRSWRPGDGHVGSAFMQDRILFTTDMGSDDAAMLLKPSVANVRGYDADVYRSFVSAPILLDVEPHPFRFGVLVLSSDVAGRFDENNKTIVAHAAQVLAHLFQLRAIAQSAAHDRKGIDVKGRKRRTGR